MPVLQLSNYGMLIGPVVGFFFFFFFFFDPKDSRKMDIGSLPFP